MSKDFKRFGFKECSSINDAWSIDDELINYIALNVLNKWMDLIKYDASDIELRVAEPFHLLESCCHPTNQVFFERA